jgi:sugar lactone lactonase YvrE
MASGRSPEQKTEKAKTTMKRTTPKGLQPMNETPTGLSVAPAFALEPIALLEVNSLDTHRTITTAVASPVEPNRFPPAAARSKAKSFFLNILREKRGGESVASFRRFSLTAAALLFSISSPLYAQGILTVTPSRTVATAAGTGTVGNSGNGGTATSATLADPSAVAYDSLGNLYLADAQNHVVREVTKAGVISIFAGTGVEGYGGDGAAATSAYLDTPTGVAVDSTGNVYIADSHNHRIRKVTAGTITTIAGVGTSGFSGDGAAATSAQLSDPMGIAVDSTGNVYIADTNNQRIRKITGTTISTIAGDGEELFAGDGSAATSAVLDSPTGVAVDSTGNVYIADRHNQRVRMITGTTISTIAGSGSASFSGSFSGDGATATSSTLSKPSGVSVDASGNIYIADTDNQRIRQLGGGAIATIVGSGQQGYGVDGTTPASINLNSPKAVAPDALGNLAISDKLNQLVRAAALPTLTYASDGVGILSAAQSITLANTGSASISVATLSFAGPFITATGGSCSALPITLAASTSCTQNIAFLPVAVGADSGSVVFGGSGVVPQSILLAGTAVQTATTTTLTTSITPAFIGQAITFTATVKPTGLGTPTQTVSFFDGAAQIGTAQTLVGGVASITTTTLIAGPHNITAVYSGDTNFTTSTSAILVQYVLDFNFNLSPGGTFIQTVIPGDIATYSFNLSPIGGPFSFPVTLSATGLPPGATVVFTPNPVIIGGSPATFTMAMQTAKPLAMLHRKSFYGGSTIAFGLLLLPFSRRFRHKARRIRPLSLCIALILSFAAISSVTGCGTSSGFFGENQQSYTITVIGTATGTGGVVLQHSTQVTLIVQ